MSVINNAEGYSDMTPFLAMMSDESESPFTDGAVYAKNEYSGVIGDPGFYLMLRGHKNCVNVLSVYETTYKYYKPDEHYTFTHGNREYYIEPYSVLTLNTKKIGEMQFYVELEDFSNIKREVVRSLHLDDSLVISDAAINQSDAISFLRKSGWMQDHDDAVAAAVSLKNAPVSVLEADPDIELVKRERDIWKEAFFAVCGKS